MELKTISWHSPSSVDKELFLTCVDGVNRKWIITTGGAGIQRGVLLGRESLPPSTVEYVKRK